MIHNAILQGLLRPQFARFQEYYVRDWQLIHAFNRRYQKLLQHRKKHPVRVPLSVFGFQIRHSEDQLLYEVVLPVTSQDVIRLLRINRRLQFDRGIIVPLYSSYAIISGFYVLLGETGFFVPAPYNRINIPGMANLRAAWKTSNTFPQLNNWFLFTTDLKTFAKLVSIGLRVSHELLPIGFTQGNLLKQPYRNMADYMVERVTLPLRTPIMLNPTYTATDLDVLAAYDPLVLHFSDSEMIVLPRLIKKISKSIHWMEWISRDLSERSPSDLLGAVVKLPIRRQLSFMYLQNKVFKKKSIDLCPNDAIEQTVIFDNRVFVIGKYTISSGRSLIATYRPEVLAIVGNKHYIVEVRTKSWSRVLNIDADEFFLNLHRAIATRIDGPEKSEISCVTSWRARLGYLALTYSEPEFVDRLPGFTDRGFRLPEHLITYTGDVQLASYMESPYGVRILDPSFSKISESNVLHKLLANVFIKLCFAKRFFYQDMPVIVPANDRTRTILEAALYLIRAPFPKSDAIFGENSELHRLQEIMDWPIGIDFTGSLQDFHYLICRYRNLLVLNPAYAQLLWTQHIAVLDLSRFNVSQLDGFDQFFAYAIKKALTKKVDLAAPIIYMAFPFTMKMDSYVYYVHTYYATHERHLLALKYAARGLGFYGKPWLPYDYVLGILAKYHDLMLTEKELANYVKNANRLSDFPLPPT